MGMYMSCRRIPLLTILNYRRYSSYCSSRKELSVFNAKAYLNKIDETPHMTNGDAVLLERIQIDAKRI